MMRLSESKENWFIFAKREHHRYFSGKDTNYRKQSQIILDLFLTTEGALHMWKDLNVACSM